jgi:hypothetical protein
MSRAMKTSKETGNPSVRISDISEQSSADTLRGVQHQLYTEARCSRCAVGIS